MRELLRKSATIASSERRLPSPGKNLIKHLISNRVFAGLTDEGNSDILGFSRAHLEQQLTIWFLLEPKLSKHYSRAH